MVNFNSILLGLFFTGIGISNTAQASIYSSGNLLIDTESGLEWLSLGQTSGMSWNDIYLATHGGSLTGWYLADYFEVARLNQNVGTPLSCNGPWGCGAVSYFAPGYSTPSQLTAIANYQIPSVSTDVSTQYVLQGITSGTIFEGSTGAHQVVQIVVYQQNNAWTIQFSGNLYQYDTNTSPYSGAFLFRSISSDPNFNGISTVPLPSTVWLFASGLGLLTLNRHRKESKHPA